MIMHRLSEAYLTWEEQNSNEYYYNEKLLADMDETIKKIENDIKEKKEKKQ